MKTIASAKRRRRRAKPPVTCSDLAQAGRWDLSLCCVRCHEDPRLLIEDDVTASDPLQGRCSANLCCRAFFLLKDWHSGKIYHSLPEHE
jgi:hypothetical protein